MTPQLLPPTPQPELTPTQPELTPYHFARHILHVRLWHKQTEILNSLTTHHRIAVKSGNGLGKGFTAAIATLWFLHTHNPAIVLTTAPTFRQVRHILWRQIHTLHRRNPQTLGGQLLHTRWELAQDRYALGLSADHPDQFQGFHSPNLLLIVDEAEGVPDPIYDAITAITTTANAQLLLLGNPTTNSGAFRRAFHQERHTYKTITISALDSPNLTANHPIIPGLVTPQWVKERQQIWGIDNPLYQSRVLGQFPDQTQDTLIPLSLIEAAIYHHPAQYAADTAAMDTPDTLVIPALNTHVIPSVAEESQPYTQDAAAHPQPAANTTDTPDTLVIPNTHVIPSVAEESRRPITSQAAYPQPAANTTAALDTLAGETAATHPEPADADPQSLPQLDPNAPVTLGIDIARFGSDHSVILRRHGNIITHIQTYTNINTMQLAGHIAHAIRAHQPLQTCIDEIGIGAGVIDRLQEQGFGIHSINVGNPTTTDEAKRLYANRRAQTYWKLRELFETRQIQIPNHPQLLGQLAALRYTYDSRGRLLIESKEQIRRRGLPSPDHADALMLSYAQPPARHPPRLWT